MCYIAAAAGHADAPDAASPWPCRQVHTNIVVFRLRESTPVGVLDLVEALEQRGVLVIPFRWGHRLASSSPHTKVGAAHAA